MLFSRIGQRNTVLYYKTICIYFSKIMHLLKAILEPQESFPPNCRVKLLGAAKKQFQPVPKLYISFCTLHLSLQTRVSTTIIPVQLLPCKGKHDKMTCLKFLMKMSKY